MKKKKQENFNLILALALVALLCAVHDPALADSAGLDDYRKGTELVEHRDAYLNYLKDRLEEVNPNGDVVFGTINWQPANFVPEGMIIINNVTYGNGQFVAAANFPGGFLTSPDGLDWTWRKLFGTQIYNDVTWGGDLYVAVKRTDYISPAVQTSSDGVTWTGHNSGIIGGLELNGVTWNGNQYVAVGGLDAVSVTAYSQNGEDWTHKIGQVGELRSVAWNGNQFVAVGMSTYIPGYYIEAPILTSADGVNWTERNSGTAQDIYDVAWGGNQFVAVGNASLADPGIRAVIVTSPDGVNWFWRDSNTTNDLKSVAYGANQFVAVGLNGTITTSPDGITWFVQDSGTTKGLSGVTWGGDRFVAVGTSGTIIVSTQSQYQLTVTKSGTGSGTVTSSPDGINCGIDCMEAYPNGTDVILEANPYTDSIFAGWSGDCSGTAVCQLTLDEAKNVTAIFNYDLCPNSKPMPWIPFLLLSEL